LVASTAGEPPAVSDGGAVAMRRATAAAGGLGGVRQQRGDGGRTGGPARVGGAPFGEAAWHEQTARALGLESALRPRGRPNKVRAVPLVIDSFSNRGLPLCLPER
jgi:hypothetical protein